MKITARSSLAAVLVILSATVLTGCALSGKLPLSHFDSPENGAAEEGKLMMSLSPVDVMTEVVIVPDTTATPPILNARTAQKSWALGGGLMYMPPEFTRLEIGGTLRINGPSELKGRYQFLGEIASKADPGNFSAALVARAGLGGSDGTDNSPSLFGSSTVSAKHSDSTPFFDINLPVGYRVGKPFLVYTGAFYSWGSFKGHIDQTITPGGTASYDATAHIRQMGYVFGIQLTGGRAQWKLELSDAFLPADYTPGRLTMVGLNVDFPIL